MSMGQGYIKYFEQREKQKPFYISKPSLTTMATGTTLIGGWI
jgi:hypothetical protein